MPEPPVVIIIPVRNEETHLEEALQSVCQLTYSHFRVLVINDRSTDRTQEILETIASRYPNVSLLHIEFLPAGWLGKNHALHKGCNATWEEWILFTDADVYFQPDTLSKAMQYCQEQHLDHLTVLPYVHSRSVWLNSLLATFVIMLEIRQRPWSIRDPASRASLGIGAFNLVNRQAYKRAGTHQAIALRPDDDLKLGERIKASGGRQDALYGEGQIQLEWYASVADFVNGLMKNMFSVYGYSLLKTIIAGVLPTVLFFVLPVPLLLMAGGTTERLLALLIFLSQFLLFVIPHGHRTKWWYTFILPVAGLLMVYIMLRSALITLKQKGIYWRETFYPLSELMKNQ